MIRTIFFLFICATTQAQDSLFKSTDRPSLFHEEPPVTLALIVKAPYNGKLQAVKFYKTDAGSATYKISVWSMDGTPLSGSQISTTATGWQRIAIDIPVSIGQSYVIGIYNPVGKYGYKNNALPLGFAPSGLRGNTTGFPPNSTLTSYYIDAVFLKPASSIPLSVKIVPESSTWEYGTDSIRLAGKITGHTSYKWEVVDSLGTMIITGLNTLNPIVTPKDEGGIYVRLMLSAKSTVGEEQAEITDVWVLPNKNERVGIITRSGRVLWLRPVIFY